MNKPAIPAETDLPSLTEKEAIVSRTLSQAIRKKIDSGHGQIGFDEFLQSALYEPGLGYYCSGTRKFGRDGDFTTAPEISSLFSKTIARQCSQILGQQKSGNILELGAGTGVMAKDILLALKSDASLPERYSILEPSPELKSRQQEIIGQLPDDLKNRVNWLEQKPEKKIQGVILANEVADALPFKRFRVKNNLLYELMVACRNDTFGWQLSDKPVAPGALASTIKPEQLPDGYEFEYPTGMMLWIKTLADWLHQGVILLVDYGMTERDCFSDERSSGSLRCYFRHRVHADPFINIGLQDITCDVNFSFLARSALESDLELAGYTTQANFLLAAGLEEEFANAERETAEKNKQIDSIRLIQSLKTLTMPDEMGERFKVMALSKDCASPLRGFSLKDFSNRL